MIVQQVNFDTFWTWLKHSDSYGNSFSLDGASALFDWLEELSESSEDGTMQYDPIAWCVEFSEYDSPSDVWEQYGNGTGIIEGEELAIDDNIILWLENQTTVIVADNGHLIVQEF